MIDLLAFALSLAGFAALSLAMDRHHRQVWHRAPSRGLRLLLRAAGTLALAASLAACIAQSGAGVGVVAWFGLLSAAAAVVALLLAHRPWLARQ